MRFLNERLRERRTSQFIEREKIGFTPQVLNVFVEPDFAHLLMVNVRTTDRFVTTKQKRTSRGGRCRWNEHFLFGLSEQSLAFELNQGDHIFVQIDHRLGYIEDHR